VFGEVAEDVPPIPHCFGNRLVLIAWFGHVPVCPNLIQSIQQERGFHTIFEGGRPMLTCLAINHRNAFTVRNQGAVPAVHSKVPARSSGTQGEISGCQTKRLLNQFARELCDLCVFINLSPRIFQVFSPTFGVDSNPRFGQDFQRALMYLGFLVLRQNFQQCFHRLNTPDSILALPLQ